MPTFRSSQYSQRTIRFILLAAFAVALVAVVPAHADKVEVPEGKPAPQPKIDARDLAQRIHRHVNRERAAHGLAALAWDKALTRVAAAHSRDMAERDYLGHDTPEGKSFSDRYRAAGYGCEVRVDKLIYGGAENIALQRLFNFVRFVNGVPYHEWNSAEQIARKTVDGWMNSRAHRENLLTPHWRHEGIGVEIHPDNKVYVTQNFC